MDVRGFLVHFGILFVLVLVIGAAVSWFYSLLAHGEGTVDWGSSVQVAVILGIVIPLATGGYFCRRRSG